MNHQKVSSGKKKFLIFCMTEEGGLAEYVFYQAETLQKLGHSVQFLCSKKFMQNRKASFAARTVLLPMPRHSIPALIRRLFFASAIIYNYLRLAITVVFGKPNLVLIDSYREYLSPVWSMPLGLSLKWAKVFCAANLHDPVRNFQVGPKWWHDWSVQCGYRFLNLVLVHASLPQDAVVPGNVKVEVVPHGLFTMKEPVVRRSLMRDKWGVEEGEIVLLSFGFIRNNKNIDLLIEAISKVKNYRLVIAGRSQTSNDKPVSYYRKLADDLNVSHRCVFVESFIDDIDVSSYFDAADLVALTYSSSFFSQSGVLNLAAAAKKPVIVSSAPGPLTATVSKFGLGVEIRPDDSGAIIQTLEHLQLSSLQPDWEGYYGFSGWEKNVQALIGHLDH
jgi:glycosyltransferase involved in cell wall biosynthesis